MVIDFLVLEFHYHTPFRINMASLSGSTYHYSPAFNWKPMNNIKTIQRTSIPLPISKSEIEEPPSVSSNNAVTKQSRKRGTLDLKKLKETEERERKEEVNRKIASKKALSVILRREATKAVIDKKWGKISSKRLLPRTVLEALHDRITALRWESALKVLSLSTWYQFFFFRNGFFFVFCVYRYITVCSPSCNLDIVFTSIATKRFNWAYKLVNW